jgi:hypothetical protein
MVLGYNEGIREAVGVILWRVVEGMGFYFLQTSCPAGTFCDWGSHWTHFYDSVSLNHRSGVCTASWWRMSKVSTHLLGVVREKDDPSLSSWASLLHTYLFFACQSPQTSSNFRLAPDTQRHMVFHWILHQFYNYMRSVSIIIPLFFISCNDVASLLNPWLA